MRYAILPLRACLLLLLSIALVWSPTLARTRATAVPLAQEPTPAQATQSATELPSDRRREPRSGSDPHAGHHSAVTQAQRLAAPQSAGATPSPTNLLLNPGFELDADGDTRPNNWTTHRYVTRQLYRPAYQCRAGSHRARGAVCLCRSGRLEGAA